MVRETTDLPNTTMEHRDRFDLASDFSPAGDQPAAIAGLAEGLDDGLARQTLLGVTGSGKTYTIASVIERTQRPAMILAPNKTLAAQLYGEMREFFPNNAVEYFVSYYDYYQPEAYVPSSDTFIEKDASINQHIEQMRLSATKALIERSDAIIVATVSAIYGLGDPEAYFSMVLHVTRGDRIDQRTILRRLAEMQYTRNELDLSQGTYRVRGDVIDVFPAESERDAVRIELFDDEEPPPVGGNIVGESGNVHEVSLEDEPWCSGSLSRFHRDGDRHPLPSVPVIAVSYTHLTLPTMRLRCRSRWSPYH